MQGRKGGHIGEKGQVSPEKKQEPVTKGLAVHAKEFAFCPYNDGKSLQTC